MSLFKQICEAVEENNRINDGSWSNWESFNDILIVYEIETKDTPDNIFNVTKAFIEDMIYTNSNDHMKNFQEVIDILEYGQPFAR